MKRPLFSLEYDLDMPYTEPGTDNGAKITDDKEEYAEVHKYLDATSSIGYRETMLWLHTHKADNGMVYVLPLTCHTTEALQYRLCTRLPKLVYIARPLHTIEKLDDFLAEANRNIPYGAYIWCHSRTALLRRRLVLKKYPPVVALTILTYEYVWHRIIPKLKATHNLYFRVTKGKNHIFNRVELLGRLYRAGFEVRDEQFRQGEFLVVARKVREPFNDVEPTGSPIVRLSRIGKDGKMIKVCKFRTMYTYSEYLQTYVYRYQNLDTGGKFKNDYRITWYGRFLRRTWLDELPMICNIIKGQMKLVGVRPLSQQYFNLYTKEMQELRIKVKPGLLPPFYYDEHTPETIEEVQESERRYLEAYLEHPFRTDWRYFWGIVINILYRKKRSK